MPEAVCCLVTNDQSLVVTDTNTPSKLILLQEENEPS